MKNWPSNFQSFSFQSSNFQFCHFNLLTFNYCQFSIPLDLNYLLPLSEPKRRCFDFFFFFFVIKKIKKTVIKKKTFFFSFSLLSDSLSLFLILYLSVSQCRGARPHRHHRPPPTTSLPPPASTFPSLSLHHSLHQNLKPKENNLTPSPP